MAGAINTSKFGSDLLNIFECSVGAYSIITPDEYKKMQLTFVGPEQEIAESMIADIAQRVGNKKEVAAAVGESQVTLKRWPDGEVIQMTISYKKKNGAKSNELRMYLNKSFRPSPDNNWCIFVRDEELWIGQFRDDAFDIKLPKVKNDAEVRKNLEPENDDYQARANGGPPESVQSVLTRWKRNPKLAARALKMADYKCELDPESISFISKNTKKPFMEAHHLVPMGLQGEFSKINLDDVRNICSLNPTNHRKLHYAKFAVIEDNLKRLADLKSDFLDEAGVTEAQLIDMYR
jgi:5-methylcytosine-specific restriction enzyme A